MSAHGLVTTDKGRTPPSTWTWGWAWCPSSTWSGFRKSTGTPRSGAIPPPPSRTLLPRRMPDYVHYITPQFSRTDINFQRGANYTSNPFIARDIPTPTRASWRSASATPTAWISPITCASTTPSCPAPTPSWCPVQDGLRHGGHPHSLLTRPLKPKRKADARRGIGVSAPGSRCRSAAPPGSRDAFRHGPQASTGGVDTCNAALT